MTKPTILSVFFSILFPLTGFCQTETVAEALGTAEQADEVIAVWNNEPPGLKRELDAEKDFTKPTDRLIAGQRIIKLGNVSAPQLHVFHAPTETRNGSAVVICPGGGFHILAWDLEGTEVAKWLNSLGVTAIVLKYRVPTHNQNPAWKPPVQDTQRAISLVRAQAENWNLDPNRIGVLGFSAGGKTAAVASFTDQRHYSATDETDKQDCQPNFTILIYAASLATDSGDQLKDEIQITKDAPPTFMVHAFDDFVPIQNCLALMNGLKKSKVPSELHIFDAGGHGYGLRTEETQPVTGWPRLCEAWLKRNRFFQK